MAEDFSEASTFFKDADFGGVNCLDSDKLCKDISGYPTIKLYKANSKEGIEYEGDRSSDDFATFVSNHTGAAIHKIVSALKTLNPFNFEKNIYNSDCGFVMFYATWDKHSKHFLPQLREAASIFEPEPNVTLGSVDCQTYHDLCGNFSISDYPTMILFKNGEQIPFQGAHIVGNVVNMINKKCGTQRGITGLLKDNVGLIEEANKLAVQFVDAENKNEIIEQMKKIEGADFYVKVMERIMKSGVDQLVKDMEKMKSFMDERKGSMTAIDGMKKRYNVFKVFAPKSTPVPTPEQAQEQQTVSEQTQEPVAEKVNDEM
ncbi:Thioredoxin family protein [Tritrichomonas foetus]|uniref:protein disulfide-isomerase n=1 Tax=Tritrichomonas foetus TaxID=1144522 RepID=A0A1J4J6W7_9EUKA|nr:Thioredoxin family protein [Tritrichomonas foetus]|eukprot:OHS93403.1 Thioredoxin family protein [Tritrichomonas foetus]